MTDHHGQTTTGTAVNVRPPTDAKRRHGTDYCAIAQIAVNRDNVTLRDLSCIIPHRWYLLAFVQVCHTLYTFYWSNWTSEFPNTSGNFDDDVDATSRSPEFLNFPDIA